jgi:hypothetical protein
MFFSLLSKPIFEVDDGETPAFAVVVEADSTAPQ